MKIKQRLYKFQTQKRIHTFKNKEIVLIEDCSKQASFIDNDTKESPGIDSDESLNTMADCRCRDLCPEISLGTFEKKAKDRNNEQIELIKYLYSKENKQDIYNKHLYTNKV